MGGGAGADSWRDLVEPAGVARRQGARAVPYAPPRTSRPSWAHRSVRACNGNAMTSNSTDRLWEALVKMALRIVDDLHAQDAAVYPEQVADAVLTAFLESAAEAYRQRLVEFVRAIADGTSLGLLSY